MKLKQEMEAIRWGYDPKNIKTEAESKRVSAALDEEAHRIDIIVPVETGTGSGKATRSKKIRFNLRWVEVNDLVLWLDHSSKNERDPMLVCGFECFLLLVEFILKSELNCSKHEAARVSNELRNLKIKISMPHTSLCTGVSHEVPNLECDLDLI